MLWGRQPPPNPPTEAPPPATTHVSASSSSVSSSEPSAPSFPPHPSVTPAIVTAVTAPPNDPRMRRRRTSNYTPRLHMEFPTRFLLANTFASSVGLFLAGGVGSRKAALRFRAENAHRAPTTRKGWYFYHKSKNYYVMLAGVKEGIRGAGRLAGITSLYLCIEGLVDYMRGHVDAAGSIVGGGVTGAVYGFLSGRPRTANKGAYRSLLYGIAAKTAKRGAYLGLLYGVTQDVVRVLSGERVSYFSAVARFVLPPGDMEGDNL